MSALHGWTVLYRISAGFCSIIVTRVLFPDTSMIIIDNEPVLFLCPYINDITKAGFVQSFVKLVVGKSLLIYLLTINFIIMNKKFSTLMAACLAAGALVLPADMFAQIRYTNGLTYADQQTETKNAEEAGESVEYYIVLNDGTKDYVAVVQDDYSLKAVEFAAANMEQTVKITKTADGFTVATGDNFLGFSTSGWGNSTIFKELK